MWEDSRLDLREVCVVRMLGSCSGTGEATELARRVRTRHAVCGGGLCGGLLRGEPPPLR